MLFNCCNPTGGNSKHRKPGSAWQWPSNCALYLHQRFGLQGQQVCQHNSIVSRQSELKTNIGRPISILILLYSYTFTHFYFSTLLLFYFYNFTLFYFSTFLLFYFSTFLFTLLHFYNYNNFLSENGKIKETFMKPVNL